MATEFSVAGVQYTKWREWRLELGGARSCMDFVSPFKGFGLDPEDIGLTIKGLKQGKDPLRLIF